jgi:hypothetical protein
MLNKTYFALSDRFSPFVILDKWFNPFDYTATVDVGGFPLSVLWTERAQRALQKRNRPLIVEMQLYFSCVVKKRTIFHDIYTHNCVKLNDQLCVDFRTVEPTSCDPEEFARFYPEKRELSAPGAKRMHAKRLFIDYKSKEWIGEFSI